MRRAAILSVLGLAALGGCGGSGRTGEVEVFAAASLTEAFTELAEAFEASEAGVPVTLVFGGSSGLARQIVEGAPADVFASADATTMATVVDAGAVRGDPRPFATNRLAIAVEPGNPLGITGLGDLARPDVTLVLCAEPVPCGRAAREALDRAGVQVEPRSLEDSVKSVVTKVALGEADAGIVYETDVRSAAGRVDGVAVPEEAQVVVAYPVAVLAEASPSAGAARFADFVLGADGRAILASHGFGPP